MSLYERLVNPFRTSFNQISPGKDGECSTKTPAQPIAPLTTVLGPKLIFNKYCDHSSDEAPFSAFKKPLISNSGSTGIRTIDLLLREQRLYKSHVEKSDVRQSPENFLRESTVLTLYRWILRSGDLDQEHRLRVLTNYFTIYRHCIGNGQSNLSRAISKLRMMLTKNGRVFSNRI